MSSRVSYRYDSRRHQLSIMDADGNTVFLRGLFDVDKANRLLYHLNETAAFRRVYDLPAVLVCEGNWHFNTDNKLSFKMTDNDPALSQRIVTFKTTLISAGARQLVCTINAGGPASQIRTIRLRGVWGNDKRNRLVFNLSGSSIANDRLTFIGTWNVGADNQLRYTCTRTVLRTKIKKEHRFCFAGSWRLTDADQLAYILDARSGSEFLFKISWESNSIRAKAGALRYRLAISTQREVFTLYGQWKFGRKAELSFELSAKSRSTGFLKFSVAHISTAGRRIEMDVRLYQGVKPAFILTMEKKHLLKICDFTCGLHLFPEEWKVTLGVEGTF